LDDRGPQLAPPIPTSRVSPLQEHAQLTLLRLDHDYELITDVTGQPLVHLKLTWSCDDWLFRLIHRGVPNRRYWSRWPSETSALLGSG